MSLLRALGQNWRRKVIAVFAAFGIWAAHTNAENPVESYSTEVPVNATVGPDYDVDLLGTESVRLDLRAPRETLAKLRDGSLKPRAALDLPDPLEEGHHSAGVRLTGLPGDVDLQSYEPARIDYSLTRMARKTVRVVVRLTGDSPPGVYFRDVIHQPEEVEVLGPKETVDAVDHVRTWVERDDVVNSSTVQSAVRAMNASGGTINDPKLTITPPLVTVSVPAEDRLSKTLPVKVETTGKPPEGYEVIDVTVEPKEVEVQGPPRALEGADAIHTAPLKLDGHAKTFEESLILLVPPESSPRNVSSVTVRVRIGRGGRSPTEE
jgi:YbbR domain-containing protein